MKRVRTLALVAAFVFALAAVVPARAQEDPAATGSAIRKTLRDSLADLSKATPEKLIRLYAMKDLATIRRGVFLAVVAVTARTPSMRAIPGRARSTPIPTRTTIQAP